MHEPKAAMAQEAEAFIALPGNYPENNPKLLDNVKKN